jgi:uncharacterized protein (TIGR02594 family)
MAKRTPVSRLDISGISTAPTARPVETYVRPAEIQSQPSALTEFVSAITPAVKAVADKQLETKLKREREIESFRLKSKYKQAELKSYEMHLKINQDYKDNADTWHEMKTEDVLTKITKYQDDYLDSLPPETDPILKETMKLQFQEYNVKTIADFNAGKTQYNNNKLNNSFKDTITLALTADEKNTVPTIQKMIDDFAVANPLPNGKPDYKRAVNVAHDLLLDMSVDNADNKLYEALDTMKTRDGKKSINVMDTAERAKNSATIRARRDKQVKTRLVVSNKAEGIQSRINEALTKRRRINKTYTDLQGNVKTISDNELEQGLFRSKDFMSLSEGEKYQAFRDMGFVPTSIKNKVLDGLTFLIAGDVSTPETNQAIENSFLNYMALKNSGNDLSFIKKEDRLRFEAMDFWVNKSAKVGEIDILQEQTEEQAFEGEPPAVIRSKNYNNAARNIQMMDFKITKSPDFTKNIKDKINEVSPFSKDLSEVSNSSFIQNEIATHAHYLMQSGMKEEPAIEKAVEIAKKDYPVVESGNGKAYGFNHLNTGVDSSLNPSEIIPKYNKLLLDSKKVKQYMFDTHGLQSGEFDVAIYPDPKNPNAAVIMAFDDEGLPLGQVGGSINKNVLLSDQQQLNNLIATGMTQDVSTTTTYTPDVNKVVSNSTSQNVIETALNVINPISTANASVLDETQVGEFTPSNQITGENVTMEGNTLEEKTANMIATQEGFSSTPYKDGSDRSVGYGFFLPALEPDEKALIKDINNVTKEEAGAVLKLKVQKIGQYLDKEIEGFTNLPEKAQSAIVSMGYQLGAPNLKGTWKKFWSSINEAAQYAEGSVEQGIALGKAQFNMLFNVAKDGTITATKWATQTKERALEMANDVGDATVETVEAIASGITNSVIPSAHADTSVPESKILKVEEQPTADMVSDIAISPNPVEAASKYLGISEKDSEGAEAVKGFFENIVGDWNPDNETVLDFASNKAWCAAFLTQVLRDSGYDTDALVSKDKFKQLRASAYANVGTSVDINQAKAGDIMIKYHSEEEKKKYKAAFGHVGVVYKVDGDQVWFIGGNSGDKVKMASYNYKDKKINIRRITKAKDIKTDSVPALLDLKLEGQITASNLKNWFKKTGIGKMLTE